MNFLNFLGPIFGEIMAALASGQASFRVGKFAVSVTLASGAPVHLTFAAAFLTFEKVMAGAVGTFQSGDIAVTISPYTGA